MADTPATGTPTPGTGDNPPAPQTPAPAPTAPSTDEMITMPKKDRDEIIRQRDTANEALRKAREGAGDADAFVAQLAAERSIGDFLKDPENAKKYPDVSVEDLMHVSGPDEVDGEASRLQARYDAVAQNRLKAVQTADAPPRLSDEDRAKQEADLKKNPDKGSFGKMLELRGK